MTDSGRKQSIILIENFANNILGGDIDKLKDFSFLNLNTDTKYHQDEFKNKIGTEQIEMYGGYFIKNGHKSTLHQDINDYDDMNLIRAINTLLYINSKNNKMSELNWNDLNWEYESEKPKYEKYKYRGETINTFNTLINESYYEEYFNYNKTLVDKITKFRLKVFSMGNFMLLPNIKIGSKSLNLYKGSCLGDYSDRFFNHILKKDNEYINELLNINPFWYNSFSDKKDIEDFINYNYLQDYFDNNNKLNYNFAPYYAHWFFDKAQDIEEKTIYASYINKYIDIVTDKIDKRAERMIADLKNIIKD